MQDTHREQLRGAGRKSVSRRRFLQQAGAGTVGLTAFPALWIGRRSAGKAKLSIFVGKDTTYPNQQTAIMSMVQKEFQKLHPSAALSWDTYASSGDELTKVETSAASQSGPDIFEFGTTLVPTAYATGAFEHLTESTWNHLGGKKSFVQSTLSMSGPSKHKTIAVPETAAPYAMVYNRKLLEDAGVSKPPATWTEFVHAGKAVTNPGKGVWGTAPSYADSFEPWHHIWQFVEQMGGHMVSPDGKKAQLDSKEVVEASAFWLDWAAKYKIAAPADATFMGADSVKAFAGGKAALAPMSDQSGIPTYDSSPIAGQYAYAPNPTVPYGMSSVPHGGKPAQGFVSGQLLSIFKYSQHKEMALDVIKIFLSPKVQFQQWKTRSQFPVTTNMFNKYPELKKSPWTTFITAEKAAYPTPFIGAWGQLEVVLGHVINQMAARIATNGGYQMSDLRSALQQANSQLQSSLAEH